MRALAKVSLLICFPAVALCFTLPLVGLVLWPVVALAGLPVAWYVLFTLPEERAEEYDIIRRLALGAERSESRVAHTL